MSAITPKKRPYQESTLADIFKAVEAGKRPLIMPTGLSCPPAPAAQLELLTDTEIWSLELLTDTEIWSRSSAATAKAALPDMITDPALGEIVCTAGVDRVLAAVEPFLS